MTANLLLTEEALLLPEGRPHARTRNSALDRLGQHFSLIGRRIYLADELAVHYPGERVFVPDILAVQDVEDPGDADLRTAWVVAQEGRGLDFVLEILWGGNRVKDLVTNVRFYARLQIAEYFVYDQRQQILKGYRLPTSTATEYRPVRPRFGRLPSRVLGLELGIAGGTLHFYSGAAEIPGSAELAGQLARMVEELELRYEEERQRAEQEQARAEQEQARAEQEQARAEQEQARAEQEQARAEQEQARAEQLKALHREQLRQTLLRILETRRLDPEDALRQAIQAETDPELLLRWIVRAATTTEACAILRE